MSVAIYHDNIQTLKVGTLEKKARNRNTGVFSMAFGGSWQTRTISLYPTHINYDDASGDNKGLFAISERSTVLVSDVDKKPFCFKITEGTNEFYLNADTELSRQEWMAAIKAACDPALVAANNALVMQEEKKRQMGVVKVQEEAQKAAEDAAAAAAAYKEEKRLLFIAMQHPVKANKKLNSELKFQERYVWVELATCEFHWGKSGEYTFKSKAVNLKTQIKEIKSLSPNSFAVILADKEFLPKHLFNPGFVYDPTAPTSVDIYLDDPKMCEYMQEFMIALRTDRYVPIPDPNQGK